MSAAPDITAMHQGTVRRYALRVLPNMCAQCGGTAKLEVDHIIPQSQGGRHTWDNLQLLCAGCHKAKTAKELAGRLISYPVPVTINNITYPSQSRAEKALGLSRGSVAQARRTGTLDNLGKGYAARRKKTIIGDSEFDSGNAAADACGVTKGTIAKHRKRGTLDSLAGRLHHKQAQHSQALMLAILACGRAG